MVGKCVGSIAAATAIGLLSLAGAGLAKAQHAHGAHVHGEAQAAIVVEGQSVSISLNSAMYNITGFERAPQNSAEEAALADAIAVLSAGENIFVMDTAADCTFDSVVHSLPVGLPASEKDDRLYRDLEASYEFTCSAPDELSAMVIGLFEPFGNLEKIDTVVLNGNSQIAISLSPDQNRIELTE